MQTDAAVQRHRKQMQGGKGPRIERFMAQDNVGFVDSEVDVLPISSILFHPSWNLCRRGPYWVFRFGGHHGDVVALAVESTGVFNACDSAKSTGEVSSNMKVKARRWLGFSITQ